MMMIRAAVALAVLFAMAMSAHGEKEEAARIDAQSDANADDPDVSGTKDLLEQLTIDMSAEVVDERTFALRDRAKAQRKLIRLGNVAPVEKGEMSDEEYDAKVEAGKDYLRTFVEKQMVFYKAAPDVHQLEKQANGEDIMIIADAWTIDGKFISQRMTEAGHLVANPVYVNELAKDILSAESDKSKKEAYKELEEALKENEKAKQQAAKEAAQQAEDEEPLEPLGFGGWIGICVLMFLVVGVPTNFGRPVSKKVNLNKKKNVMEKFFRKLKGA